MSTAQLYINKKPLYFGDDVLELLRDEMLTYNRIFFLSDFRTLRKCLPLVEALLPEEKETHTLVIQEGERFKNVNTAVLLWKQLQDLNAKRNDIFVNVGGGVVGDIGAFVAATFKRGMKFINVPTSLLAMVDAAVGGKAGVDLENVKNQIGLFAQPESIYIYPPFLKSLEQQHIQNGFGEIIKYALIADAALWKELQTTTNFTTVPADLILKSAKVKAAIVNEDPLEEGKRKVLNFGHTIGHAFETYSMMHDNIPLLHGEAIAYGMICEAWLATQKNKLSSSAFETISKFITKHFAKYTFPLNAIPQLVQLMMHDKKNDDGRINFSMISEIGKCDFNIHCEESDVVNALNIYHDLKF